MSNLTAKVVEDNGGGIYLYVFSKEKEVYIHCGYEHREAFDLLEDLQVLIDHDSIDGWEGNELDGEDNICNLIPYYNELEFENKVNVVIASLEEGNLSLFPEKMGVAGKQLFNSLLEKQEC